MFLAHTVRGMSRENLYCHKHLGSLPVLRPKTTIHYGRLKLFLFKKRNIEIYMMCDLLTKLRISIKLGIISYDKKNQLIGRHIT